MSCSTKKPLHPENCRPRRLDMPQLPVACWAARHLPATTYKYVVVCPTCQTVQIFLSSSHTLSLSLLHTIILSLSLSIHFCLSSLCPWLFYMIVSGTVIPYNTAIPNPAPLMFRSAGSSQPAGRRYSVFSHLLNRACRAIRPISCRLDVERVISHQFLYVFTVRYGTSTDTYQSLNSGVQRQCIVFWNCHTTDYILNPEY